MKLSDLRKALASYEKANMITAKEKKKQNKRRKKICLIGYS